MVLPTTSSPQSAGPRLSGHRFVVVYHLAGSERQARARARELCVEQTVEFPPELLPRGPIREAVVGRVEQLQALPAGGHAANISYAVETVGSELTQLLNVLMGNSSLKQGIRVERLELPQVLLQHFAGPRHGRRGLRELLGAVDRPLLCTALKPMGLGARQLAAMAGLFVEGGMDIIKDDHGLADQPFCPFEERVARCAEAVELANQRGGRHALYAPNVSAPAHLLLQRAHFAREAGAGALLVAPGLVGFDSMRLLATELALPILCHPALLGSLLIHPSQGFSCFALLGQLTRLAGADAVIYPHHGGRFPFSEDDCRELARGTAVAMGQLAPIFPTPAGGIHLPRLPRLRAFYGDDVMFLIGGDLHHSGDLIGSCQKFRALLE